LHKDDDDDDDDNLKKRLGAELYFIIIFIEEFLNFRV